MNYYNDKLNPKFWNENKEFDPQARQKLLKIADDFFKDLKLDVPIDDIQLTGSLANYNWNKHSDLDVHILIDFAKINEDEDLVKKAVDGVRFIWNLRHDIVMRDHEVEMYIQDTQEPHVASGLYSLKDGKWITEPQYDPPMIDERDVTKKFDGIVDIIKRFKKAISQVDNPQEAENLYMRAGELKAKIQNMRREGLARDGEFSVENLVFKKLRNTNYMGNLIDLITAAYDKIYSESKVPTFKEFVTERQRPSFYSTGRHQKPVAATMTRMDKKTGKMRSASLVPKYYKVDSKDRIKTDFIDKIKDGSISTPKPLNGKDLQLLKDRYNLWNLPRQEGEEVKINKTNLVIRYNPAFKSYVIDKKNA